MVFCRSLFGMVIFSYTPLLNSILSVPKKPRYNRGSLIFFVVQRRRLSGNKPNPFVFKFFLCSIESGATSGAQNKFKNNFLNLFEFEDIKNEPVYKMNWLTSLRLTCRICFSLRPTFPQAGPSIK